MMNPEPVNKPINVKPHMRQVVLSETASTALSLGFAILAYRLYQSEAITAAVFASAGILFAYVWRLAHRVRCWINLRFLANQVPDSVAKVGK